MAGPTDKRGCCQCMQSAKDPGAPQEAWTAFKALLVANFTKRRTDEDSPLIASASFRSSGALEASEVRRKVSKGAPIVCTGQAPHIATGLDLDMYIRRNSKRQHSIGHLTDSKAAPCCQIGVRSRQIPEPNGAVAGYLLDNKSYAKRRGQLSNPGAREDRRI